MSHHDSSPTPLASMPDVSGLFASCSGAPGFWYKEPRVPTSKNGEEATYHPPSSFLLHVDITRESRSAQYSRNKAKNGVRFARAQESKRQDQPQRGRCPRRNERGKRSGKREPIPQDWTTDMETDYERGLSVSLERPEIVLAPVRMCEGRPISASISSELQPPTEKSLGDFTPPDVYTTTKLPESTFNIPAPDTAREFRSYEYHRRQTKKRASFMQFRKKKGAKAKPGLNRSSKSVKAENLQSLIDLTMADEQTSSEDEIQTPIEVSPSRAPPTVDMEALITTAKVRSTKEPDFEFVKGVPPVVALDDSSEGDDDELWEHVWNDDLVD